MSTLARIAGIAATVAVAVALLVLTGMALSQEADRVPAPPRQSHTTAY